MTSRAKNARDDVATLWAATTPPTRTAEPYREVSGRNIEGERLFWFEPESGTEQTDFADTMTIDVVRFVGNLRISTAGDGLTAEFDRFFDEGVLLKNRVNFNTSWGTGVRYVRCNAFTREDTDSDDYLIRFELEAEVEEIDGA